MNKMTFKQFLEAQSKTDDKVIRDYYGKPLRGLKKQIALQKSKENKGWDKDWKDKETSFHYGNSKVVRDSKIDESQLEQKQAQDVWDENKDSANEYETTTKFLIRPSEDKKGYHDVFTVQENGKRKFQDQYKTIQIGQLFRPVSQNSTPDVEGFREYLLQGTIDALKWNQDPIEIDADGVMFTLRKGDYLIRELDGKDFVFTVETRGNFESAPRKKV